MVNAKDFNVDKDTDAHWWCKALVKIAAVIAAFVCGISGLVACFSLFEPICIGAGIIMLAIAFILILLEAPICCMFSERTHKMSTWLQERRYWQKGLLYVMWAVSRAQKNLKQIKGKLKLKINFDRNQPNLKVIVTDTFKEKKGYFTPLFFTLFPLHYTISIIPVIMCRAIGVIIGCLCSFAVGVIYGLMSLGKKASRQEMSANAAGTDFQKIDIPE